jgi:hypothetical protein
LAEKNKEPKKFIFITDTHYGSENKQGKKVEMHDARAIDAVLQFASDFKPDIFIHGGDLLDLGAVSHWNKSKRKSIEGLRVVEDTRHAKDGLLAPINEVAGDAQKIIILGNHERFLLDLLEDYPGLEGIVDIDQLLGLTESGWTVIPQGGVAKIGKLHFMHGDTLGGRYHANAAILAYERSIRYGHFHTFQSATKISAIDITDARTSIAVPCLCKKAPGYGRSAPNSWLTGFLYGYIFPDGSYNDSVVVITNNRFAVNGKVYKG